MTTVMTPPQTRPLADPTFRVLFSLIFVLAGLMHLVRPDELVTRLLDAPLAWMATAVGPPRALMVVTGLFMLPTGLGLMLGFRTRLSAVVLIALLIPITVVIDLGNTKNLGPLFKNIALFGGLIHFAAHGPGAYALDNRRRSTALPTTGGRTQMLAHTKSLLFAAPLIGLLCVCGAVAGCAGRTPDHMTAPGVVLLVRTPRYLGVALKSAGQLRSGPEVKVPVVEIVVCDEAVKALAADPQLAASIAAARQHGISTRACGLSLERFAVPATTLPPGVDVVPNGLVETLRLQSLGYLSSEL